MKDYPEKVASILKFIRKSIKNGLLTDADIRLKKEEDGNYIIYGQYKIGNTIMFLSATDNTAIDKT
jgi:hypothetical protein